MTKSTAQKRGRGTAQTSPTNHPALPELLSAVLRHPETPADMYNCIGDVLGELTAQVSNQRSPEFIARVLEEIEQGEGIEQGDGEGIVTPETVDEDGPQFDLIFQTATYKDARRIAHRESFQARDWSDEEISDFLALIYCLTYCEPLQREGIMYEVVRALMPNMACTHRATELLAVGRFRAAGTTEYEDQGGAK